MEGHGGGPQNRLPGSHAGTPAKRTAPCRAPDASHAAAQALFEGSMFMFVLEWTPALSAGSEPVPHGYVFAAFMVAIMIGSAIFKVRRERRPVAHAKSPRVMPARGQVAMTRTTPENFMRPVFNRGRVPRVPTLLPGQGRISFAAFILFEDAARALASVARVMTGMTGGRLSARPHRQICVGIFWPAMGTMRSVYVPRRRARRSRRSSASLNLIVVAILLQACAELSAARRAWRHAGRHSAFCCRTCP